MTTSEHELPATPPLLAIRDLTINYQTGGRDVPLVRDVAFDVGAGEIVCLVGESGSGKTLTARSIMGLLRQNKRMSIQGEIQYLGTDLNVLAERQLRELRGREIAMIFQDPVAALDPVMSVGKQIAEAVARRHSGRQDVRRRVFELIDRVGISDPEHRVKQFPHEISGGMCQRVSVAIALAGDPKLLIADEPTTALDVTIQAQVLDLLKQLRDERGMSVLLITHDMGVAAQTADRIIVMYAGSVVEVGSTAEFFAHPGHPYSVGLIKAVPRVRAERLHRLSTIRGSVPEARDRPSGCPFHPRCPLATDLCREAQPPLAKIGGQLVACHRGDEVRSGAVSPWEITQPSVPVAAART